MARLYGWAPVGERCRDSVPFGYRKAMPPNGRGWALHRRPALTGITAPWVLDGRWMAMPSGSMSATSSTHPQARRRRDARQSACALSTVNV